MMINCLYFSGANSRGVNSRGVNKDDHPNILVIQGKLTVINRWLRLHNRT